MTGNNKGAVGDITLDGVRDVANRLGFAVSDDVLRDVREASTAFLDQTAKPDTEARARESTGRQSDDGENALLDVYETPRQRVETDPLAGERVAVKDNLAAQDLTMTCGSGAFETVPTFDASVVDRLLDAGASLVGKANMDAFAFGPSGEFTDFDSVENRRG